jgi:hypothetical protein
VPAGRGRIDVRAARNTARHLVEGWGLEAARRLELAEEYREHVLQLAGELRSLQRGAGTPEHDCPTCRKAAAGPEVGNIPL